MLIFIQLLINTLWKSALAWLVISIVAYLAIGHWQGVDRLAILVTQYRLEGVRGLVDFLLSSAMFQRIALIVAGLLWLVDKALLAGFTAMALEDERRNPLGETPRY